MKLSSPTSLADHIFQAAQNMGALHSLVTSPQNFTFASLALEIQSTPPRPHNQADAIAQNAYPSEQAISAYRASYQNRPFWPVHRSTQASPHLPPEASLIISTSGSEGQAKAVMLSNEQLTAAARAAAHRLELSAGDQWLNCLPLYHIGGQAILWRCAIAGATVVLHNGFDPAAIARDFAQYRITHISLVPAMLARLLDSGVMPPASLRCAMIGGAALSQILYERGLAAGWPLRPSYGMSETCAQIATWQPADGKWREGRVGRVMPGHEIAIAPDGRIRLRGPQLMLGYLDGGGLDADAWFTTGDLGQIDNDGCLTIFGRADDMLISGGRNVHPLEVESCLAACPGVRDVAVTGQPDLQWGDLIVALIVGNASREALLEHARQHLHSAALPRRFIHLEEVPRNAAGKIERSTLRSLVREADA